MHTFLDRLDVLAGAAVLASSLVMPASPANGSFTQPVTCGGRPATIVGTQRGDTLVGTAGDDVIAGLGGIDSIHGGAGDDLICGGRNPLAYDMDGIPRFEDLFGGPGNDVLIGGPGWDALYGSAGDDVLLGSAGADWMLGGLGADRLSGGLGIDEMDGQGGGDRISGGPGRDYVLGGGASDVLRGNAGVDRLSGGTGNDRLLGGPGEDAGDYALVKNAGGHCHTITADLGHHTAGGPGFGNDTLDGVEDLWSGGGDDVLVGDARDNTFFTGIVMCGRTAGLDHVDGAGGTDTLTFDNERLAGSGGGPDGIHIDLAAGIASWESNGVNQYQFTAIENVVGTSAADEILGDDGPNVLTGGQSSTDEGDIIRGRGGDDVISGHLGADHLYGDDGNDRLDGGPGNNTNDGGMGVDACMEPGTGPSAISCEAVG